MAEPWEELPDVAGPSETEPWEALPDAPLAVPDEPVLPAESMSLEERAQRTVGPVVVLQDGTRMLRSGLASGPVPSDGREVFTAEGQPLLPSAMRGITTPEAEADVAYRESRNAQVRAARQLALEHKGSDLAQATALAKTFNVPVDQVLPHLGAFREAAAASQESDDDFYAKNKVLVDSMGDDPALMAAVIVDPNVSPLVQALRTVKDAGAWDAVKTAGKWSMLPWNAPTELLGTAKRVWDVANGGEDFSLGEFATGSSDSERAAEKAADLKKRKQKQTKFESPEAKAIREEGTAAVISQRAQEAWVQQKMMGAAFLVMLQDVRSELGADNQEALDEARAAYQTVRAAATRPLLLGDEGTALGMVGDNLQALTSSAQGLMARGSGFALGTVGGAIGGAIAGGLRGGLRGARAGAAFGADVGGAAAANVFGYAGSFVPETGGAYIELTEAKTEGGLTLSKLEAAGGAIAYGSGASVLENLGAEGQMRPLTEMLQGRIKQLLLKDPYFRKRAADMARHWATASLTEGGTEGAQAELQQLVEYAGKSLKDEKLQSGPMTDTEQTLTEGFAGALGGGVITAGSTAFAATVDLVKTDQVARTSAQQVALLSTLAGQDVVKAAPEQFARVVAESSGVTEFYVDVDPTVRLFQKEGKSEQQILLELEQAGGAEVVDNYKAAVATGGKFQVPMGDALKTWLQSELGQKLLMHTTTADSAPTPAQLQDAKQLEAIREHAEEMAKKAIVELEDEAAFEDALEQMRRDIVETSRGLAGISNPQEYARDAVNVARAVYATAREENSTWTWKQTLQQMGLLEYARGDEAPVGETRVLVKANDPHTDLRNVLDFGGRTGGQLDVEERAGLIFVDKLSHLRDQEAFDLEGLAEGEQVAMVTTPDAKAVNDHPEGSHPSTNALLRRMASVVQQVDPRAARIGPNFAVRVRDQAALDSFLAQLREVMPAGMQVVGALGADRATAGKALDETVAKQRKDGLLPKRGGTAFDVSKLPITRFDEGVKLAPPAPLTDVLLSAVDAEGKYEGREALGNRAFLDAMVPGLLSGLGFDHVQKGKYTVALDLKQIRAVNMMLGKHVGDAMLRAFGEALVRNGGQAFSAAHLSGDEYALTHDSKEALEEFIADVEADLLASAEVEYTLSDGKVLVVDVGFRWGLAEGDYGQADRNLNARKLEEPAKRKVDPEDPNADPRELGRVREDGGGKPGDAPRRDGGPEVEGRGGVQLREARAARRRGSERSRPFRDVAQEAAAESAGEGFGDGADERSAGLSAFASPEVLTEARAWVATLRSPARKARFNAWLDYAAGLRERPTGDLFLERGEGVELVDMFGGQLDDPNGTFFDTPFLQGIGPMDYTGPRRGAKRARRGEGDRSEAARNEARMADANRARGVLAPDATGRLLFQEGNRAEPMKVDDKRTLFDMGPDEHGTTWVALSQSQVKGSPTYARHLAWTLDDLLRLAFSGHVEEIIKTTLGELVHERIVAAAQRGDTVALIDLLEAREEPGEDTRPSPHDAPPENFADFEQMLVLARNADELRQRLLGLEPERRERRARTVQVAGRSNDAAVTVSTLEKARQVAQGGPSVPDPQGFRHGFHTWDFKNARPAVAVWVDQVEEQTGRMFQKDDEGQGQGVTTAPTPKPFRSNAERRRAFATDRELALKRNAITPRGPLPERVGEAVQKVAVEAKRARKAAADTAADAILRGEKVRVDKTGRQPTIREVALALQRRQRAKHGVISDRDFSQEAAEKISDWMAQEAAYEYEAEQRSVSGAGWYSERFQTALDLLSEAFPRLKEQKNRDLMTAIIAITSDGQAVGANLKQAVGVWQQYEATGTLAVDAYRPAITENLAVLDALMRQHGDGLTEFLLAESTVGEMKRQAEALGLKFSTGYSAETVMPRSAVLFGPKLGAFFANLMGKTGYLTMDRWWSRTFARYRGTIVPEPTRSGLETFKKLLGDEEMDDDEALLAAAFAKHAYEDKDYKNGTPIEKAGNTIAKAAFLELKDRPGGAAQRDFMIRTAQMAVDKLKARGVDLTLADLQAVLWYFEKRLYSTLGARDSKEDSYEDAVAKLIIGGEIQQQDARGEADASGAADDAGPGRSAAQVARGPDRRAKPGAGQRVAPGEEGSPAGHAGRVDVERLYQREQSSAPKLADGRSVIVEAGNQGNENLPSDVWLVDVEGLQAELERIEAAYSQAGAGVDDVATQSHYRQWKQEISEDFKSAMWHLREGRPSQAYNALAAALPTERALLAGVPASRPAWNPGVGPGDNVTLSDGEMDYGARVPPEWTDDQIINHFIKNFDVSFSIEEGGAFEGQSVKEVKARLRAQVARTLERLETEDPASPDSRIQQALRRFESGFIGAKEELQTGEFADDNEGAGRAHAWAGMSEDDKQVVQVALDEFEQRTGRMYQATQHKLADGRNLLFDTQRDETVVAAIDLEKTQAAVDATREKWAEATVRPLRDDDAALGGEGLVSNFMRDERDARVLTLRKVVADLNSALNRVSQALNEGWLDYAEDMVKEAMVQEALLTAMQNDEGLLDEYADPDFFESVWDFAESMVENQGDQAQEVPFTSMLQPTLDALSKRQFLTDARAGKLGLSPADQQVLEVAADEFEATTGRMRQDEADLRSTPRGYFERPPRGAQGVDRVLKVFLNKKADRSTVMHESAHGFLEMYRNLQDAPDLADPTKKRWERILKWLKVESTEAWDKLGKAARTEKHERWAKAFELYNKEGRAPSKGLAGTMARMKRWLTRIYGTVANIDGVELDDEVRAIFDSMLATEKEIAAQAGRRGKPVFNTAEEAGMTEEEFAARQEEEREELSFATREAAAAATRAALRVAEQDYREQLEAVRAEAEAEFDTLPGRRAQLYLEGKAKDLLEVGVSMEPVVLDRRAVEEVVGGYGAKKFRTRNGAANPDDVAPLAGFTTGREMLQAVASLPKRDEWVEQRAKALVEERDPANTADLERLRAEVADGVQRYTEQRIEREWDELGRRAEPGSDVSALGRQVALQALKKAARTITDKMRVGRLNPAAVLQKERHASRLVRQAANKGNIDAARDWFRQQTLQVYTHRAVLDAIEERRRFLELAERLAKKEARQRLGKADPRLRDAVDYLLGVFGLGPETELTGEALTAAAAAIEETGEVPGEWLQALQVPELLGSGDAMNLTVAGLRHLDAALRQLYAIAKFRNEVMVGEKLVEREFVVDEMVEQGTKVLPRKPAPVTKSTESTLETLASFASEADGFLLNPADLLRDLTGDDTESTWWRAIVEPLRRAKYREAEHLKKLVEPITAAMEAMPEAVKRRLQESIDGRKLFPGHIDAVLPRRRHELLMMALNVGNDGNLQRLTDGRHISIDEVAKALDLLTDSELAWVQTVWDAAGSLREEAFALEERMTGLRPRGVEAVPFRLPSGRVLKGGYFPAVYDRRASVLGQKQAENTLASLMDPRMARIGTAHSHLKARVERVEDAALSLDVAIIYRHLAQVAHDLAFREPLKSVGSLLLPGKRLVDGKAEPDNRVMEVLRERLGVEKADTFITWLKDVGGATGSNVTRLDSIISKARAAFAHVVLGWKASTALGDFANLPAAVASTKLKTKHLAAALKDCARSPMESRKKALEASPWLRTMVGKTREQFDRAMRDMLHKGLPAPLQWYKDHAFDLMEGVAIMTTTPVWMGSYRQAIAEGADHDAAVRFADDVLSQVFPSHHAVDVAGIIRNRGLLGLSTVMYGYLSVAYRAQHRLVAPLREQAFLDATMGEKAVTLAKVSGRLLGFYVAFSVMGELLMGRGPEAGDKDDDDPDNKLLKWGRWFLRKLAVAPLSTMPLLPFDRMLEAKMLGKREPSPRSNPMQTMYEMIGKEFWTAVDGDKPALERIMATLNLAMRGVGLPVSPFNVQGKYLLDVALGEQRPEGVLDVAEGLLYGKRENQPENLFTAGRDVAGWLEEKLTGSD